jgi:hypothetical protein
MLALAWLLELSALVAPESALPPVLSLLVARLPLARLLLAASQRWVKV